MYRKLGCLDEGMDSENIREKL